MKGPVIYFAVEPERRKRIVAAYSALAPGTANTIDCIDFVRKRCGKRSLSHFLDTANEKQVRHIERLLNV